MPRPERLQARSCLPSGVTRRADVRVAAEAAESALIAVMVLIAAGLRIGVPESVQATRQPIAKPHRGYAMVERADVRVAAEAAESARMIAVMVLIAAGIAK